jgi:hypothetical protein
MAVSKKPAKHRPGAPEITPSSTAFSGNAQALERALRRTIERVEALERILRTARHGIEPRALSKAKTDRPVIEKSKATLDAARAGGQAQMLAWVDDQTLIPSKEFGARRGVERQALASAVKRNALFSFKVNNLVYYPAVLADMPAADSSALCLALGPMSPGKKLLFLLRKHGALDGLTVWQAVHESKLARVLELAAAWADEDSAPA